MPTFDLTNLTVFKIKGNLEVILINPFILQMGSDKGYHLPEDPYLKMTRTRT